MTDPKAWLLYSTESEPTHLARPNSSTTYCGASLEVYRPQGRTTDPSAFQPKDQFCTECLYEYLGANAISMVDDQSEE